MVSRLQLLKAMSLLSSVNRDGSRLMPFRKLSAGVEAVGLYLSAGPGGIGPLV